LSAKGLEQLFRTIRRLQKRLNPNLKVSGILMTMFDGRTNYAKENIIGPELENSGTPEPSSLILTENPNKAVQKLNFGSGFTLPEQTAMKNGSSGILSIPRIGVYAGVFESEDVMEAMSKGVAHFPSTNNWNGNVGLWENAPILFPKLKK
jgi:hypothetical protein